ncbi:HAD-IA family hydrolase [Pseudomonas sp. NPDC077382]
MKFEKALFMSNFGVDMGMPEFRVGSFLHYLLPLSKVYMKATQGDARFLLGAHTLDLLNRKQGITEINESNAFIVDASDYASTFGIGDEFILQSYNQTFQEKLGSYKEYFHRLFSGWEPDVVFCWEFPTEVFRNIFPKALVLDIMPGAYMRPPYPKTLSFDPVGLYKNAYLQSYDATQAYGSHEDIAEYYRIRDMYADYFQNDINAKSVVLDLVDPERKFEKYWLVPLQVSGYFGFYANSKYRDQFEFLTDVLSKAPKDVGVIVTQYIGSLVSDKVISNKNLGYLRKAYPNFLYSNDFEKIDNLSQYIVPWAEATITVSSTLGFQTIFYGKKLISPSFSHLSYISSSFDEEKPLPEGFVASIFCRQNILAEKLLNDSEYFMNILTSLLARKSNSTNDVLQSFPRLDNLYHHYASLSPFSGADNQIRKIGGSSSGKKSSLRGLLDKIEKYNVVSFDVFDTLLRREVFKPEDAFILIREKIKAEHSELLPPQLLKRFPELRAGFERQLRKELDEKNSSLEPETTPREEFYIEEVYERLLSSFGIPTSLAPKLVEVEQQIELSVLKPRSLGKLIYEHACATNKRVILVSDFTHQQSFVEKALQNSGYSGYERIYVSSEIGLKKHSGRLFHYVIQDMAVEPSDILHVGDNSTGDFERAKQAGIHPIKIFSTRERVNQIFKNRKLELPVLDNSFYLRAATNLFAESHFDSLTVPSDKEVTSAKEKRPLFNTPGDFGYLAFGPLLYEFTKWILDEALAQGCKKVVFFARDCYLPYEMATRLTAEVPRYKLIEPVYLAVSRKALSCLNLNKPNDCFKVRLDDFSRNKTIGSLLRSRFKIDTDSVDESYYKKWQISNLDMLVKDSTLGAIYGMVHEYLLDNWDSWNSSIEPNKKAFKLYLESKSLSTQDDIVAVDFGYKGSAHAVVSEFFSGKFIPLFLMTYSGELGDEPYPGGKSFACSSFNVQFKRSTPLISHNLIIETIVNEPVGSLASYSLNEGEFELVREEMVSEQHISKIRAIHAGALRFCDDWIGSFENLGYTFKLESNSALYYMQRFLQSPVKEDLDILRGLEFDNSYAGIDNIYILSPGKPHEKDIWKEGLSAALKLAGEGSITGTAVQAVKKVANAITKTLPGKTEAAPSHAKASPAKNGSPAPIKADAKPGVVKALPSPKSEPSTSAKKDAPKADIKNPAPVKAIPQPPKTQARPATPPKETAMPVVESALTINGEAREVLSLKSIKSYHRTQFLHKLAKLAYPGKECRIDDDLIEFVPTYGKDYVMAEFLSRNGGIWASKLKFREKIYLGKVRLFSKRKALSAERDV